MDGQRRLLATLEWRNQIQSMSSLETNVDGIYIPVTNQIIDSCYFTIVNGTEKSKIFPGFVPEAILNKLSSDDIFENVYYIEKNVFKKEVYLKEYKSGKTVKTFQYDPVDEFTTTIYTYSDRIIQTVDNPMDVRSIENTTTRKIDLTSMLKELDIDLVFIYDCNLSGMKTIGETKPGRNFGNPGCLWIGINTLTLGLYPLKYTGGGYFPYVTLGRDLVVRQKKNIIYDVDAYQTNFVLPLAPFMDSVEMVTGDTLYDAYEEYKNEVVSNEMLIDCINEELE